MVAGGVEHRRGEPAQDVELVGDVGRVGVEVEQVGLRLGIAAGMDVGRGAPRAETELGRLGGAVGVENLVGHDERRTVVDPTQVIALGVGVDELLQLSDVSDHIFLQMRNVAPLRVDPLV